MRTGVAWVATGVLMFALGTEFSDTETKTETVFIDKWKTREVVETKVVREPLPESCRDIFNLLGDLQKPVDVLTATAGELMIYADAVTQAAYERSVPKINREVVRIRLAKDDLGTAGIDVAQLREKVNNGYVECQQDVANTDE